MPHLELTSWLLNCWVSWIMILVVIPFKIIELRYVETGAPLLTGYDVSPVPTLPWT
uniref:ATPase subunit 8 n=1 Tax=Sirembo imberbis TaxID=181399 RepID=Q8HMG5_SIRIM|nr:ATP synthase F0 subunit 8 [Sirembo imberbis]BAC23194.1 ATPase subunit 8 [Sirembo imberbis]